MRGCLSDSFNGRTEVICKQKHSQEGLGCLLYCHPPTQKPFHLNTLKSADNSLKIHDIIPGKIPTDKDKNTCKK